MRSLLCGIGFSLLLLSPIRAADQFLIYSGSLTETTRGTATYSKMVYGAYVILDLTTSKIRVLDFIRKKGAGIHFDDTNPFQTGAFYPASNLPNAREFYYYDSVNMNGFQAIKIKSTASPVFLQNTSASKFFGSRSVQYQRDAVLFGSIVSESTGRFTFSTPLTIEANNTPHDLDAAAKLVTDLLKAQGIIP